VSGEWRHVTAVLCDLVDLTGIAVKLDPDEWRDLVGAYLDAASDAVTKWGGKVVKKLGDGLIALFGYPFVQDNDLQRAAHAACLIQRSHVSDELRQASLGSDTAEFSSVLEMALSIEGLEWK
jgi:class 3 adenylate cyclase